MLAFEYGNISKKGKNKFKCNNAFIKTLSNATLSETSCPLL